MQYVITLVWRRRDDSFTLNVTLDDEAQMIAGEYISREKGKAEVIPLTPDDIRENFPKVAEKIDTFKILLKESAPYGGVDPKDVVTEDDKRTMSRLYACDMGQ